MQSHQEIATRAVLGKWSAHVWNSPPWRRSFRAICPSSSDCWNHPRDAAKLSKLVSLSRWVLISKSLETTKIPGWPEAGVIKMVKIYGWPRPAAVSDLDHHWQIETAAPSRTAWRHQAPATGSLLKYIVSKIATLGITWWYLVYHHFPPLKCIKIAILLHPPKSTVGSRGVLFSDHRKAFSAQRRTLRKNAMTWLRAGRDRSWATAAEFPQRNSGISVGTPIYGYGSIPINTIFSGMNIHKSQLFWCSPGVQGFDTLPYQGISRLLGYCTSQEGNNNQ